MCGATSYRPVIERDASGALRPTSLFRCSGCSVVFTDPKAWRDGEAALHQAATNGVVKLTPDHAQSLDPVVRPAQQSRDFATYMTQPPPHTERR